jgi:hypothetical protein
MKFKILNSIGEALPINTIDEEVANFFQVPVQKGDYASPIYVSEEELKTLSFSERMDAKMISTGYNWYDVIGFRIATEPKGIVSPVRVWEVLEEIFNFRSNSIIEKLYSLLAYWEEKGYTLISV